MKYGKIFVTTIVLFVFLMSGITFMTAASIPTEPTAHSTRDMGAFTRDMGGGDAYDSYGASDSATTLSTPASGTGTLTYSSDQYDQYKVAVSSGDEVTVDFTAPSGSTGLDVPIYDTDKSQILIRYNVGTISETVTASGNGYIYITLDADRSSDTGTYSLAVTVNGGGGGGEDDGGELTDGVAASGNMDSDDGADMWYIDVGANAESMYVVLTCGSSDFDTYGKFGSEPTTSSYDWRGYTSGGEENTVSNPQEGRHYIMVDWYSGSGAYTLTATITYGSSDTTPPSVSITNPSNGATVSDTVSITFTASDANGISSRAIKIDGVTKSTSSSYSWDTTGYSNGQHTIRCEATDPSSNTGYDEITVTVDNQQQSNELTSGQTVTSSLAAQYDTEMWIIQVDANAQSMQGVLTCGSADFDLYGRLGAEPTTSTYDWRGYTSGGEDVTFSSPGQGTWYIMVRSYSGTGSYDLTVTINYGGGGNWGTGGKYAILVGISDYQSISDLSYCDEDATDWYWQLDGLGYECHVYGDGHTSNYPRYDGTATEATVRADMQDLAAHAQSGDTVVFATSGHGSGNGYGSSYLCMWDCSGSAGCYYDT
jgi:hypothetical protein